MRAPNHLGRDGGRLWRRVARWLAEHDGGPVLLDPHEEAVLGEACRVADRLSELRAALDGADLADAAMVRLLAEERQQRVALSTLLIVRLGLPTGLADEPRPKGSTPRSRRAQSAARARWGARTEEDAS